MTIHVECLTRIQAAGNKPKLIDEFIGRVNSGTASMSIARMQSPPGWEEPGQTPEFDEYTVVLRGMLRVETQQGVLDVQAGQAVATRPGSGRRLREIGDAPRANLACIVVSEGGTRGRMFTSPDCHFKRVTSEFNTHQAVHHDQMRTRPIYIHAVLHAQPTYATFLSHISSYQEERYFNTHLLRWQPEMIMNLPEGVGVLPFLLPVPGT